METVAADRLVAKIQEFVRTSLDPEERKLFAALLAPAIARAHEEGEVQAYGSVVWSPTAVPEQLLRGLYDSGLRVSFDLDAPSDAPPTG